MVLRFMDNRKNDYYYLDKIMDDLHRIILQIENCEDNELYETICSRCIYR